METWHLIPGDRFGPDASWWIVVVVAGCLWSAWWVSVAWAALRAWRGLRRLRRDLATGEVRDGRVVLAGHVFGAIEGDDEALVKCVIELKATPDEARTVVWREVRREIRARTFDLELDSGRRVLVEADGNLALFTRDLVRGGEEGNSRLLVAKVSVGEKVFVRGTLAVVSKKPTEEAHYRSGAVTALALCAPSGERLELSTIGPDFGARWRARALACIAVVGLAMLAGAHFGLAHDYLALRFRGELITVRQEDSTVEAIYVSAIHSQECDRIEFSATLRPGLVIHDRIVGCGQYPVGGAGALPFTIDRRHPQRSQIGHIACISHTRGMALLLLFGLTVWGSRFALRAARPWYARTQLEQLGARGG